MYQINEDKSIYVTRGDILLFTVSADDNGADYIFKAGDVVRIKVFGKKNAENVVLQKDFPATAGATEVEIFLDENDTKIGKVINKPTPYWYEVELNPLSDPQTIIGYDEDGPKVFMLYPEGKDVEVDKPDIKPEDMPIIDKELDITSPRPVENQAVTRAIVQLDTRVTETADNALETAKEAANAVKVEKARVDNLVSGATAGDEELVDVRVGADGVTYASAGAAVRGQFNNINDKIIDINYMDGWVTGGYTNKFGEFVGNTSYSDSKKIPCLPNERYVITIKFPAGIKADAILSVFNFYNANGEFVSGHPTALEDTPAIWTVDSEANTTTYILTVPDNDSLRFFTTYINNTHWEECEIYCGHGEEKNYRFNGGLPISSVYFDKKIPRAYIDGLGSSNEGMHWNGKNWYAFGTSITDTSYMNAETGEVTGKFVPYLAELGGLNVTNCGIAGGCIGSGGIHGGTSNILNRILETDLSDADLITIEGFVNDFACAVAVGDIGDTENTTICGALYQAIKYCLENSHATVVLLTESYGRQYTLKTTGATANYSIDKKNSLGLIQKDYNDAIIKMGAYMGVPVIDCGGSSHINNFHPEFIIDQIHHTELGGKQYANTIWKELKNISPLATM
jgi:hypothetical protein